MQESYAEEMKAKIGACEPDREAWKKLCISFLKGGLWWRSPILKKNNKNKV